MKIDNKKTGEIEVKLIIFLDDDDKKKEKYVTILERTELGVKVRLCDDNKQIIEKAAPFEIPQHRVLKIKDVETKE